MNSPLNPFHHLTAKGYAECRYLYGVGSSDLRRRAANSYVAHDELARVDDTHLPWSNLGCSDHAQANAFFNLVRIGGSSSLH